MRTLTLLIGVLLFLTSCNQDEHDEPELQNIEHLVDTVLEIDDREGVSHGESDVFNAYIYAIRLNSDGTYQLLDDNYGQVDYWITRTNVQYSWTFSNNVIEFESYSNGNPAYIKWEIVDIQSSKLQVKEVTKVDNVPGLTTFISSRQEVR